MKAFRVFLLVVLAVLLPVRGAVAAAMLCPPGTGTAPELAVMAHSHDAMVHADGAHDHAAHEHGQHDHGKGGHDKCNVCSSSCSSPSMPSASLGFAEPEALSSQSFPDLSAPAPTFQSDGQERPPRTL